MRTSQDPTAGPYSTSTETQWTFRSKAPATDATAVVPLLQFDYAVPTDTDGTARGKVDLTLAAAHLPGATGHGAIGPVGLEISYDDGAHWRREPVNRAKDGTWRVDLRAPTGARFASIRATARDASGNSVTQTVIRAFGVRRSSPIRAPTPWSVGSAGARRAGRVGVA